MLNLRRLIGIIILAFLCVIAANAQSHNIPQKINQPNNYKKISDNKDNNTAKQPSIQNPQPSPNLQKTTQDERYYWHQNPKEDWKKILQNPVAVFTGIIAIFTILLVVAGFRQVAISRNTAVRQLRAYVHISSIAITNVANPIPPPGEHSCPETPAMLSKDCGPIAFVEIKNTGQTPAYDVLHGTGIGFHEFPLKDSLSMSPPSGHITKGVLPTGGPSHKMIIQKERLSTQEMDQLRSGTAKIYVYGVIKYKDTFGKSRTTYYRYMHPGEDKIIGVSTVLTVCDEGNKAD